MATARIDRRRRALASRCRSRFGLSVALLVALGSGSGCAGHRLMPTPNVYLGEAGYPAECVPHALRTSEIDLLYVTDRQLEADADPEDTYRAGRSKSLAYGRADVVIGRDMTWEELVDASETSRRRRRARVRLRAVHELGHLAASPSPFTMVDGAIVTDPEFAAREAVLLDRFRAELTRRLTASGQREVVLFIHGFNTTFVNAVVYNAEMWHFLGRYGVPIVYSWPAASHGLLGYGTDRENGEFTVFHLKQLLRALAATPEIESIHILAHSRGADVATTALRELVIESRAAGRDPNREYRIRNLVLAAPDLDFGTVGQRLIAERFGPAFGRITIYANQSDRALDVSEMLFGGVRFGRVQVVDLADPERDIFHAVGNVHVVEATGATDLFRHEYFWSSPEVSSDFILVIRDSLEPGAPGRPLIHQAGNFWQIPPDYPFESGVIEATVPGCGGRSEGQ